MTWGWIVKTPASPQKAARIDPLAKSLCSGNSSKFDAFEVLTHDQDSNGARKYEFHLKMVKWLISGFNGPRISLHWQGQKTILCHRDMRRVRVVRNESWWNIMACQSMARSFS